MINRDEMEEIKIKYASIIEEYYKNNGKKMYSLVDKIINKKYPWITDRENFYMMADYKFLNIVLHGYDETKGSLEARLHYRLEIDIMRELKSMYAHKRIANINTVSLNSFIDEDCNVTIGDTIASDYNLEDEVITEKEDKVEKYLEILSKMQRKIVEMLASGYKSTEIKDILHISNKEYNDNMMSIQSYENILILM